MWPPADHGAKACEWPVVSGVLPSRTFGLFHLDANRSDIAPMIHAYMSVQVCFTSAVTHRTHISKN